jgi:Tol biopolymer transport system component
MRNLVLVFILVSISNVLLAQQKIELTNWLKGGPVKVYMPIFNELKNVDGANYNQADFLKNLNVQFEQFNIKEGLPINLAGSEFQWSDIQIAQDSLIPGDIDSIHVILLATYLNTDSWINPKIKIKTNALCEIYIDNSLEKSKSSTGIGETEFSVKLNRGKHLILLKLISTGNQIRLSASAELAEEYDAVKISQSNNPDRTVTISDILDGEKIRSAQISPSGNYLIVSVNEVLAESGNNNAYWMLKDLRTGKDVMYFRNQKIGQLSWLPRSDRLTYTVSSDEMTDIYVYDLANGNEQLVANDLKNMSYFKWAPGEEFIVYAVSIQADKPGDLKRIFGNDDRLPYFRDRSYLHLFLRISLYSLEYLQISKIN